MSAEELVETPEAVVTVTYAVPLPAGLLTTICVDVSLTMMAVAVPNFTAVAPVRFLPVIVTWVPPAVVPDEGLIELTVGAGAAT